MKKILSVILVLSFLLFAFAVPTIAEDEPDPIKENTLNVVNPEGGAYIITTLMKPGIFKFNCGFNNTKTFKIAPQGIWVGIYEIGTGYVWSDEVQADEPDPKMMKLSYETLDLISGAEYKIVFFIRDAYNAAGQGISNTFEYDLFFTAP